MMNKLFIMHWSTLKRSALILLSIGSCFSLSSYLDMPVTAQEQAQMIGQSPMNQAIAEEAVHIYIPLSNSASLLVYHPVLG
jgi:hypothetical protein